MHVNVTTKAGQSKPNMADCKIFELNKLRFSDNKIPPLLGVYRLLYFLVNKSDTTSTTSERPLLISLIRSIIYIPYKYIYCPNAKLL